MENKDLLPIGTKVHIRDDSGWKFQGYHNKRKMVGHITRHKLRDYDYVVKWDNGQEWLYRAFDVYPIEEQEINEEQVNNELKQLFNQILNN
jgi:hypothetical protein